MRTRNFPAATVTLALVVFWLGASTYSFRAEDGLLPQAITHQHFNGV